MIQRRNDLWLLMASGLAALAWLSAPTVADDIVPAPLPAIERPVEVPGVQEFSGRLIARPWPVASLHARGLTPEAAKAQDARARARLDALAATRIPATDEYLVPVPLARADADLTLELAATGEYEYVHPDWLCFPAGTPGDPEIVSQYFHERLESSLAWGVTPGMPSVIIAICDTGIDLAHPEFAGRLVSGYNAADALEQSSGGAVQDINGHGTLVAGSAAATRNNDLGGSGIAPGISIMPVRVSNLESGGAPLSQITAGARWAADHGARVVSVSFSGVTNPTVQTTGAYVRDAGSGGVLCWAAGNFGQVLSPAADWPDVLIVGSVGPDDEIALTSNVGVPIDCVSPGIDIFGPRLGGGFWSNSGTSFATPIAAGTVALLFSARPDLTPAEAAQLLTLSTIDLGSPGEDTTFGAGRVNTYRALWAATRGPDRPVPGPDAGVTSALDPLRIDVLANDADVLARPLSIFSFDVTTSLGGTVSLSPGTGPGDRDELLYTPPAGGGIFGQDQFTYWVSNGVEFQEASVRISVLDPTVLRAAGVTGALAPGLAVRTFDLEAVVPLRVPTFAALAPVSTGTWSQVDFAPTLLEFAGTFLQDNVGAEARGVLTVPADGFYRLSIESDDGARLFIGSQLVVNNDGLHENRRRDGLIGLRAGRHPLLIEFFERAGSSRLAARIAGPGLPDQVIPASMLSRTSGLVLDINEDGSIDPDDLGDYINLFFSGDLRADTDGNGQLDPDDLGDYINAYFAQ
ncbi:MAG: S8 family serine peptidase [Phycisphaerales bacterium]